MAVTDLTTVAANSFGITLEDTFRTAAFGGEQIMDQTIDPALVNNNDHTFG